MVISDQALHSKRSERSFLDLEKTIQKKMSGDKSANPCNKFQANFFNKSKCQNCFKSRELHLLTDNDMDQAKPIYGGWLCLAPEGTDFDNPMQRSRKWQRRFFILYEHGSLSFALDELRSTLPQGTVNMKLCTEVIDAEPKTGQRNALCIITPEQQLFIRGENKEIINGWSEQLVVYPRTNKQNQKKKRKVEPTNSQEPCPAKMAATEPSFPAMESALTDPRSSPWQEEQPGGGPDVAPVWSLTDADLMGSDETPAGNVPHYLPPASKDPMTFNGSLPSSGSCISSSVSSLDSVASSDDYDAGSNSRPMEPMPYRVHAPPNSSCQRADRRHHNETERLTGLELVKSGRTNVGQEVGPAVSREGRSEARSHLREKLKSCGDIDQLTAPLTQRRAKSLDCRTTESIMTPDLLNFKKGWMVKLDMEDRWKKYWFVLSADNLRYYKDSIAEEASDLEGEIDLTMCYNVSEYQVQRNYGFQIHTQKCVYTLSAMTAGIRRNWIQALMKNVHPSNAPDVAILPELHIPCNPPEALPKPDVTQDSSSSEVPTERVSGPKQSRVRERRREGRSRTFDWAEFRLVPPLASELGPQERREPVQPELGDVERKRRREERKKRYEDMLGFPLGWELDYGSGEASARPSSRAQQRVQEEIEQCWQQVEKTVFRQERTVPLYAESQSKDTAEIERLLEIYRKRVEELKAQLAESDLRKFELEVQLNTTQGYKEQALNNSVPPPLTTPLSPESDLGPLRIDQKPFSCHTQSLADTYRETRELLLQQEMIRHSMQEQLGLSSPVSSPQECSPKSQTPSIWLQDADGNLQELELAVLPGSPVAVSTSVVSPDSVVEPLHVSLNQNGGENRVSNLGSETSYQQTPSPESHTKRDAWSPDALSMEETGERANHLTKDIQNVFETLKHTEQQAGPDQGNVNRLSQEVELLTNQNEALNQRNQEMLNQLTEADREIERLKAELVSQTRHSHFPEAEQLSQAKTVSECLEKELRRRDQQHQEAQSLLASLDQYLRDTKAQLQLREATLKGLGFQTEEEEAGEESVDTDNHGQKKQEYLHQCLQNMEAKMVELERQLQDHNTVLREAERLHNQRAAEAEANIRRLKEEVQITRERTLEKEGIAYRNEEKWQDGDISISGEEKTQEVVEAIMMRSKALGKILEVIDLSDMNIMNISLDREREDVAVDQTVLQQLQVEEEFWRTLLKSLKANPSQSNEDKLTDNLLSEMVEHMIVEKQILRLAHNLFSQGKTDSNTDTENGGLHIKHSLKDLDIIGNTAVETVSEMKETSNDVKRIWNLCNGNNEPVDIISRHFNEITQEKMFLFNQIALSIRASANEELQSMAERLCYIPSIKHSWVASIHCTAMEALSSYRIRRLNYQHKRELQDTKQSTSLLMCSNCSNLLSENMELRARLSDIERQLSATVDMATLNQGEHMDSGPEPLDTDKQKTKTTEVNIARKMEMDKPKQEVTALEEVCMFGTEKEEEVVESDSLTNRPESPRVDEESESGSQNEAFHENVEERTNNELDGESEPEAVSLLRDCVKDLEEQLSVMAEKMTQEHDGKMLSLQLKHEKGMEKLKAIYEHGFATMEESHERVLGELQHRHQLDLERLQRDSNRLLEEETAATVTAIEAMKSAHRMELEREIQRACQANINAGNVDLEEICRQHSEELASCQRQLDVLSQQYSLKCLECAHLAQALEAERRALCQCQQENQDMRTLNQEVNGHLAAEITRLCSLAKQDALPLSQQRDAYELEITLRVKDSEAQYLKQEIISLKEELQTAQKEKRFATEKYKDIYTELSIMRAKAERDIGLLRDNLSLAHNALEECLPLDTDTGINLCVND